MGVGVGVGVTVRVVVGVKVGAGVGVAFLRSVRRPVTSLRGLPRSIGRAVTACKDTGVYCK